MELTLTELRDRLRQLKNRIVEDYLQMGELLQYVTKSSAYKKWGYHNFSQYVESELGFKSSKAYNLIDMYNFYKKYNIKEKLDPSKVYLLVQLDRSNVLKGDNVKDWIDKTKSLTIRNLVTESKIARGKNNANQVMLRAYLDIEDYKAFTDLAEAYFKQKFNVESCGKIVNYMVAICQGLNFSGTEDGLKKVLQRLEEVFNVKIFYMKKVEKKFMYDTILDLVEELIKLAHEYLPYKIHPNKNERIAKFLTGGIKKRQEKQIEEIKLNYDKAKKHLDRYPV